MNKKGEGNLQWLFFVRFQYYHIVFYSYEQKGHTFSQQLHATIHLDVHRKCALICSFLHHYFSFHSFGITLFWGYIHTSDTSLNSFFPFSTKYTSINSHITLPSPNINHTLQLSKITFFLQIWYAVASLWAEQFLNACFQVFLVDRHTRSGGTQLCRAREERRGRGLGEKSKTE